MLLNIYVIIKSAIKMKNKMYGNNTKNHATLGAPPLHIILRTHVQNNT